MARFNNNMFQDGFAYEDFDKTGIMDPGMADVLNMRKEANAARDGATNQYEADVADFKNTQATEAEQGIASLPEAPTNQFYNNAFKGKFPIGADGEPIFEDVDYTGMPGSPINTGNNYPSVPVVAPTTNPYQNVFIPGEPEPVYDPYVEPEEIYTPYTPPGETYTPYTPPGEPEPVYDPYVEPEETVAPVYPTAPTANSTDDITTYTPPNTNSSGPAVGDVDFETGLVWDGGTFVRPTTWNDNQIDISYVWNGSDWVAGSGTGLPDLGIVDPNVGANSGDGGLINNSDTGGDTVGSGSSSTDDTVDQYDRFNDAVLEASFSGPVMNYYTGKQVQNPYQVFEQPTTPSNYTRPMSAADFGSSPGITTATTPSATYTGLNSTNYTPPATPELAASQLAASLAPFLPPEDDTATTPPGMNQGGRVPMGNNNTLNSGLSRLPINLQNDTLTQVFQSGFRPRR